jgi:hypothetical protein
MKNQVKKPGGADGSSFFSLKIKVNGYFFPAWPLKGLS